MTLKEHLALPIGERIWRYKMEFLWGDPDFGKNMRSGEIYSSSRTYRQEEMYEYILYRLKLEEFELKELEKTNGC